MWINLGNSIFSLNYNECTNFNRQNTTFFSSTQIPRDTNRTPSSNVSKVKEPLKTATSPTSDYEKYRSMLNVLQKGLIIRNEITEENLQFFTDFQSCHWRAQSLCQKYNSLKKDDEGSKQKILYELLNPSCHDKQPFIRAPISVQFGYNLTIGKHFVANGFNVFLDGSPITIGDNCTIGAASHIYATTHPIDPEERLNSSIFQPVTIGNNVSIGGHSVICPGVTIGDNVVIANGSIVAKDVPSNVHVGGVPAQIIRQL